MDEPYYRTLLQGDKLGYNVRTLFKILNHLNKMYTSHDKHINKANKIAFADNLGMDSHLNLYFAR